VVTSWNWPRCLRRASLTKAFRAHSAAAGILLYEAKLQWHANGSICCKTAAALWRAVMWSTCALLQAVGPGVYVGVGWKAPRLGKDAGRRFLTFMMVRAPGN
jgi:hypothetical protein